jgi:hypothetical protein
MLLVTFFFIFFFFFFLNFRTPSLGRNIATIMGFSTVSQGQVGIVPDFSINVSVFRVLQYSCLFFFFIHFFNIKLPTIFFFRNILVLFVLEYNRYSSNNIINSCQFFINILIIKNSKFSSSYYYF